MQAQSRVTLALPSLMRSEDIIFSGLSEQALTQALITEHSIAARNLPALLLANCKERLPYAAISALGNNLKAQQGFWLSIDPVELLADTSRVYMVGNQHLLLETTEAEQLLAELNTFLAPDNLVIQMGSSSEWYLQLPFAPKITTAPLVETMTMDIHAYMPVGDDAKFWGKIVTELQMLLFQSPINEARQQQGKRLVNSVWLWGEGDEQDLSTGQYCLQEWTTIWSDLSLVKGIVMLAERTDLLQASDEFSLAKINQPGNYLIALDHVIKSDLLQSLLPDLLKQVVAKRIKQFTLILGNGRVYSWVVKKSFWRRFF